MEPQLTGVRRPVIGLVATDLWKLCAPGAAVAYRVAMERVRARARLCGAAACLILGGALFGCAAPETVPTPTPTASTPATVFASEEEALAAAEKAYADYLAMSDRIGREGGANPERLQGSLTKEFLESEVAGFNDFAARGLRLVGESQSYGYRLQSVSLNPEQFELRLYACLDVSGTDVVDRAGSSVVPADRDLRVPLEVQSELSQGRLPLLLKEPITWNGQDFCK
ncbi:hypothetical protein [Planctomonas psychrotolerans]|uniref:hypothetical protein n=1 Tax=Planctomonas psychrotolerans TaxID=2528712 RepID=UPI00123BAC3A|nr:hypothetical protein [Planctomonas psychrotolerans]